MHATVRFHSPAFAAGLALGGVAFLLIAPQLFISPIPWFEPWGPKSPSGAPILAGWLAQPDPWGWSWSRRSASR